MTNAATCTALLAGLIVSAPSLANAQKGDTACRAFATVQVPGAALSEITAEWFAAGSPPPPEPPFMPPITVKLPAYCRLDATLDRRTGADGRPYGIGFAIALARRLERAASCSRAAAA